MNDEPIPWEVKNGELISIKMGDNVFRIHNKKKKAIVNNNVVIDKGKVCPKCKVKKDLTEFYRDASSQDGRHFYCKVCDKKRMKEYNKKKKKEHIDIPIFDMEKEENQRIELPEIVKKDTNNHSKTMMNWAAIKLFKKRV